MLYHVIIRFCYIFQYAKAYCLYWIEHRGFRSNHARLLRARKSPSKANTQHTAYHTRFRAKPQWVINEVIKLCALMPHLGCRKIAMAFNAKHALCNNMTVSHSYVANKRKQHHYNIIQCRRELKHRIPKPLANNRIWALDLITVTDSRKNHPTVFGIIDHGSRASLLLQHIHAKTSITLVRCLLNTIERYGKPQVIKTDNEACFTSCVFRFSLWLLGIKHQRSLPYRPWMNGRIERLFGTLRERINLIVVEGHQIQQHMDDFRLWYNHVRPHQHLYGNTPANVWSKRHYNNHGITVAFSLWDGVLSGLYVPPDD